MYELICGMAGIRAGGAGWKSVRINPHLEELADLEGQVTTPKGNVEFVYRRKENVTDCNGGWNYHIVLPAGLDGEFIDEDGNVTMLQGGRPYDL